MFSKVLSLGLALGLAAIALVQAAPAPTVSCNVNFGTSYGFEGPGIYKITNGKLGHLRFRSGDNAVYFSREFDNYAKWNIVAKDDGTYALFNVGFSMPAYADGVLDFLFHPSVQY
ncbi:hypothetical protein B0H17DRAFT_1204704 [Mycena rosella]|uniref:Uncharacterized protein n=1 Tax=Mycena rosella TaxID=1033263 RepID=A0AAD7D935_MYCRO|nr:hypothetical protein B0H17DRAFT_1204704 [Mycena rosella]